MAGFSGITDFINQITTNGKIWRTEWWKATPPTSAAVATEWFCMLRGAGTPPADVIMNTGTNGVFQVLSAANTGVGYISSGPAVDSGGTAGYKHVISASAFCPSATSVPSTLMLVDLLGFYRITGVTSTGDQALTNTLTLPRYTDGKGVQAFIYNNNAVAMGAPTPNISITYTRISAITGLTGATQGVLPIGKTAAPNGLILYSGTGVGKYGPFMPLLDGDLGLLNVTKVNLSVSYASGEFSIVLCRPILEISIPVIGVISDRDFLNQIPSLPKVYDGACLTWLIHHGVATPAASIFTGHLEYGWS